MLYTTKIIIELPLEACFKKFNNPENLKHWQKGLINIEHISGTPRETGSKTTLFFKFGKRNLELTETITKYNFPNTFHANYDTKGMHNVQENFFLETTEGYTEWTSKNEFLATNFKLRMMTLLMPSIFKKQTKKYLEDFKNFAEREISIAK